MIISQKQKDEYVKDPCQCPYCGSANIQVTGNMKVPENEHIVEQEVLCFQCERSWWDVYSITSIREED